MAIPRNLSNLAPGADSSGVLGVSKGGTGSASLTANNVLLGNGASTVQFVAPGASGNVLSSDGTTWQSTAPSVGALTLISTQVLSGATEATFTGITDNTLLLSFSNVTGSATTGAYVACQFGNGSYLTSSYAYYVQTSTAASTYTSTTSGSAAAAIISSSFNSTSLYANGAIYIYNTPSSCSLNGLASYGPALYSTVFNATNRSVGAKIDRLKFYIAGGTITGTVSLYKIAQ